MKSSVEFHVVFRCDDQEDINALYRIAKRAYEKPVSEGMERTVASAIIDAVYPFINKEDR